MVSQRVRLLALSPSFAPDRPAVPGLQDYQNRQRTHALPSSGGRPVWRQAEATGALRTALDLLIDLTIRAGISPDLDAAATDTAGRLLIYLAIALDSFGYDLPQLLDAALTKAELAARGPR